MDNKNEQQIGSATYVVERVFTGPLRKFCVSVFRQNQEYHIIDVHDWGSFPLATAFPRGWGGMRALCGVNAVPASRES